MLILGIIGQYGSGPPSPEPHLRGGTSATFPVAGACSSRIACTRGRRRVLPEPGSPERFHPSTSGDGGEFFGCVQDHGRSPQEVAGHFVGAGEPTAQDRIRAWQGNVAGQTRFRRLGDQAQCFPQEEGITAGQPEKTVDDGLVGGFAPSPTSCAHIHLMCARSNGTTVTVTCPMAAHSAIKSASSG